MALRVVMLGDVGGRRVPGPAVLLSGDEDDIRAAAQLLQRDVVLVASGSVDAARILARVRAALVVDGAEPVTDDLGELAERTARQLQDEVLRVQVLDAQLDAATATILRLDDERRRALEALVRIATTVASPGAEDVVAAHALSSVDELVEHIAGLRDGADAAALGGVLRG